MASLKDIKSRISSVKKTQQITKAMKMVAASKMKKATNAIIQARPYANKLKELTSNLQSADLMQTQNLLINRPVKKVLLIVVAADKGLCGGFNNYVRRAALGAINEYKAQGILVELLTVGRKSTEFSKRFELKIVKSENTIFRELVFSSAIDIMNYAKQAFINGETDKVEVIYNRFVNAITQKVEKDQLLPVFFEPSASNEKNKYNKEYIYEPNREELISILIPRYLNFQVWRVLLESNASEQAARMMAMDSATNNAGDLIKKLRLSYNKIRQANITREISEIVGGAVALQS
jgi:F-type H+-transporting ATPase subunit gamma